MYLLTFTTFANAGTEFTIDGRVRFEADYHSNSEVGQVPAGTSDLPYLRVCAWDEDDQLDFEFTNYPTKPGAGGNDEFLGCDVADGNGYFSIDAYFPSGEAKPDIYLVTRLCNGQGKGAASAADVCIRVNAPDDSAEAYPSDAKAIWSTTYDNVNVSGGGSVDISWNLSCPGESGLNDPNGFSCSGAVEPADWDDPAGAPVGDWCRCEDDSWKECENQENNCSNCGDTNSRYGCNKEAVHAYRAAIEPYVSWGSNKPTSSNTYNYNCESQNIADDHCIDDTCQDEINLRLSKVRREGTSAFAGCSETASDNSAGDYDKICIITPDQPFRIAHEIGHIIQNRWICDDRDAREEGTDLPAQNKQTREGWADYVGTRAWFGDGHSSPKYCNETCWDVEATTSSNPGELTENDVAKFFWDLDDSVNDSGWNESEKWTFKQIRNTWSAFPYGDAASESSECDPDPDCEADGRRDHGVNVLDFAYWFREKRSDPLGGAFCDTLEANYVDDEHNNETLPAGEDYGDLCP